MTRDVFFYRVAAVPDRYPDRVQQEAVLFPLMGWPRVPPGMRYAETRAARARQIIAKFHALRSDWRKRVEELGEAGWRPAADTPIGLRNRYFMVNCRPTFVIPKGATGFRAAGADEKETFRRCGHDTVCPFCYARWVRKMWARFDYALFQDPAVLGRQAARQTRHNAASGRRRNHRGLDLDGDDDSVLLGETDTEETGLTQNTDVDLVWSLQHLGVPMRHSAAGWPLFEAIEQAKANWRSTAATRSELPDGSMGKLFSGGLHSLAISPRADRHWSLTIRTLMIAPHGIVTADQKRDEKNHYMRQHVVQQPRRREVVSELAKLLRYPKTLMSADPQLAARALHGRLYEDEGREKYWRMCETMGSVRKASQPLKALGIETR